MSDPYGLKAHNARIGNPHTVQHSPKYYFWQRIVFTTFKLVYLVAVTLLVGFIGWFVWAMLMHVFA